MPSTRRQDKKRVPLNSSRSLLSPAPPLICVGGGAQFWSIVTTRKLRNSLAYPSCKPQKVGSIVSSLEFHSQLAQTRLQKAPLVGIDIARLLPSQEWGTSNNQRQTTYTPKEGIMHRLQTSANNIPMEGRERIAQIFTPGWGALQCNPAVLRLLRWRSKRSKRGKIPRCSENRMTSVS